MNSITIMHRESLLQGASTKYNDFHGATQSLDTFLDNLPNNKIRPSDNLAEVKAKQISQEVGIQNDFFGNALQPRSG